MFYYEVTTIIIIGTGLHFKYNYIPAFSADEAIAQAKKLYEQFLIDGCTAERCGIPLSEVRA